MRSHRLTALALFTALSVRAPSAIAAPGVAVGSIPEDGYAYRFDDDPLSAMRQEATGGLLRVRRMTARPMLLRPRLHFVPEMLKSVESL
jgi:hypothetical protein